MAYTEDSSYIQMLRRLGKGDVADAHINPNPGFSGSSPQAMPAPPPTQAPSTPPPMLPPVMQPPPQLTDLMATMTPTAPAPPPPSAKPAGGWNEDISNWRGYSDSLMESGIPFSDAANMSQQMFKDAPLVDPPGFEAQQRFIDFRQPLGPRGRLPGADDVDTIAAAHIRLQYLLKKMNTPFGLSPVERQEALLLQQQMAGARAPQQHETATSYSAQTS
jgi:hypothetical protein